MVTPSKILEARERLARREPLRAVARATGLSRSTVHRIAQGSHISSGLPLASEFDRCPECGAKVKAVKLETGVCQCLACTLRKAS